MSPFLSSPFLSLPRLSSFVRSVDTNDGTGFNSVLTLYHCCVFPSQLLGCMLIQSHMNGSKCCLQVTIRDDYFEAVKDKS